MTGLGICTYNRPDYFKQSIQSAIEAKPNVLVVYNDGSTENYEKIYKELPKEVDIIHWKENKGVAAAKNTLLKKLLDYGCDHLFLMEDDIIIKSPRVFDRYISAGAKRGLQHLNFAHHGPANEKGYQYSDGVVEYYPHCVGAFSYYTRECIEEAGFMDENFKNALEHIEHTKRIGDLGLTSPFSAFADISGSRELLGEIEGSIENSSIRNDEAWMQRIKDSLAYWKSIDPECPVVFGFEKEQ